MVITTNHHHPALRPHAHSQSQQKGKASFPHRKVGYCSHINFRISGLSYYTWTPQIWCIWEQAHWITESSKLAKKSLGGSVGNTMATIFGRLRTRIQLQCRESCTMKQKFVLSDLQNHVNHYIGQSISYRQSTSWSTKNSGNLAHISRRSWWRCIWMLLQHA